MNESNFNNMNNNENNINNKDTLSYNNNQNTNNNSGYIALYLSLVLVGIFALCFILSGGNFDEQDGIAWLFAGIYCYVGELPVMIASIIFGVKGLKENNKIPSYASFIINLLKIVILLIIISR